MVRRLRRICTRALTAALLGLARRAGALEALIGLALIVVGVWMMHRPTALIVAGVVLFVSAAPRGRV